MKIDKKQREGKKLKERASVCMYVHPRKTRKKQEGQVRHTQIYQACAVAEADAGSRAMNGPAWAPLRPIDRAIARRFSSHARNERKSCTTLSTRPCLTSLILTLPIRISLSKKKSKSLNRPSSRSSSGPDGNAESGTGGSDGFPLIPSARRNNASPPEGRKEAEKRVVRVQLLSRSH